MVPDYVAMAGPAFVLLILVELFVSWRRGRTLYRLNDAVNDVATGMIQQLSTLFVKGLLVAGYLWIFGQLRLVDLSDASPWTWVVGFLAVDLAYYWFHRLSHEINFLWAAHVVHHQSEDFNLAVALRQSALQPVFGSIFYWPLALVGIPPAVFLTCSAINTLYQFWLHTQTIRSLGPLEEILVTPSHHRVHHGRNPLYLDRNHGGIFIVWDRLFGTFQREQEEVVYGITKPLESWNPIWANLHYWVELFRTARAARRPFDKLRTFVAPPGWRPADLGGPEPPPVVSSATPKFDRPYPPALIPHAVFQFAALVAATIALANAGDALSLVLQVAGVAAILWGLVDLGALFEGRVWALDAEIARLVATPVLLLAFGLGTAAMAAAGLYVAGSLGLGWRLLRERPALRASTGAGGEAIC